MAVKKLNRQNCCLLYGDDLVSANLRKNDLIRRYFRGNPPDVTVFDGNGSYEEYKNALEGQSLFNPQTAVVIHNPFFLKRISKSEKEDRPQNDFLSLISQLPPDTFLLLLQDGKPDKRTKIMKSLLSICYSEELSLMNPKDAAGTLIRMLADEGKQVDYQARAYLETVLSSWDEISAPLLQTECDKIVLMCGNRTQVTQKLLEIALPEYMNQGIFRFTDALLDKNSSVVLESADRVFTDISTTIKNLGFLSAKFRKIKIFKEMQRNRRPEKEMWQALGIRSSWMWKNMANEARKVKEEEAEWFLLRIFDYQLKSRQGSSDMELKDLLLEYCMK